MGKLYIRSHFGNSKKGITVDNFNITFSGNIPAGSGMSSSAALENAVVFGLNKLFDLGLTKTEMIIISQKAEHNYVGVNCGIMDQYASMFGIKNHALLLDCRTIKATPFEINFEKHELMLINTNVKHSLSDSAYNDRRSVCEKVSSMLNIKALRDATEADLEKVKDTISNEDFQKALFVIEENKRAENASKAMTDGDLKTLGALIYSSHDGLQNQYKVSCDELDFLVQQAKENQDILGARMMGGGFGGCTINLIAKTAVDQFKTSVSKAYKAKFDKDCSIYSVELSDGTHLIK
ncbi:galactokinase [Thalassobellus suaedae]|uniref:Galactokinase n=1 Tax=Thalassobellus suaedae TaxID=3074124 RepID=A0ABY9Y4B2_9FLAO|nr:galactokinase [Flavobacteriaceae bacterium HL-DH10]